MLDTIPLAGAIVAVDGIRPVTETDTIAVDEPALS